MSLVGVVGFQSSGKDTIGRFLIEKHNFQKDSFAKPLKDACAAIFGWSRELMEGQSHTSRAWREEEDSFWSEVFQHSVSPRWAMQYVGTNIMREHIHPDIWVLSMKRRVQDKLSNNQKIVITDCRFPNEIQAIRDLGGIIIRVIRGKEPEWIEDALLANNSDQDAINRMHTKWKIHESEWSWIGQHFDYVIHNNGDIDNLKLTINSLLFEGTV